jgi:hypothetical protein
MMTTVIIATMMIKYKDASRIAGMIVATMKLERMKMSTNEEEEGMAVMRRVNGNSKKLYDKH